MYESLFDRYYRDQANYGYGVSPTFYRAPIFQRGSGINHGAFSSILKSAMKVMKPAAKFLGRKAVQATADTANKLLDGKSFRQSIAEVGDENLDRVKRKISKSIRTQLHRSSKTRKRRAPAARRRIQKKSKKRPKKKTRKLYI